MEITLKPLPKQDSAYELLFDKDTKYILFGGKAGGGKSWLIAEWMLIQCIRYPGVRGYIGRNELKRLMNSTYVTFTKVCEYHNIPRETWKLNGQYNFIEFDNGSRIDLLDVAPKPSDPMYQRFGSAEYTFGALEEAGEIDFLAFDVLKSRTGRHLNKENNLTPKILVTANPANNWLKRIFYKPWKEKTLEDGYAFVPAGYEENVYIAEEYDEMLNSISDRVTRERLKDGNWDYDEDGGLVKYDAIIDLYSNTLKDEAIISALRPIIKYVTVDIARYGRDNTVLIYWEGLRAKEIKIFSQQDLKSTADQIDLFLKTNQVPRSHCIIDEVGVGGGVIDQLSGVKGFIANASPRENPRISTAMKTVSDNYKENYRSLKDQCGYMLAVSINNHEMAITCDDEGIKEMINEELQQLRQKDIDKDTKLGLIPKDEIKQNIGRSPDLLDALMMRMYFELKPTGRVNNFSNSINKSRKL